MYWQPYRDLDGTLGIYRTNPDGSRGERVAIIVTENQTQAWIDARQIAKVSALVEACKAAQLALMAISQTLKDFSPELALLKTVLEREKS